MLMLIVFVGQVAAQNTLHGRVVDSTGARIPGIEILVKESKAGLVRTTLTDETGAYSVPGLPDGVYVIPTELPGFAPTRQQVDLGPNTSNPLDFNLTTILSVIPVSECPGRDCGISSNSSPPDPALIAAAIRKTQEAKAERLVGSMWEFSMQPLGMARGDGRIPPNEVRRREIAKQLHELGENAVPALSVALRDPDVLMRRNAALVLAGFDSTTALADLIDALQDADSLVRAWSAQAIGAIGPAAKPAVPALIELLKHGDEAARNSSCIGLRNIGPAASEALPALREALNDPSKDVRGFAQQAIDKIQRP
jgi:hypothetical protein